MRTIRRLIYVEVFQAVVFVCVGFLALFFFFDFIEELPNLGKGIHTYKLTQALVYVSLRVPNHLYELLPIAVLIGTIFVMARFAQSSEYTILRTSGLGPWRALRTLVILGAGFTLITFAAGDYLAPLADRTAQLLKARMDDGVSIGSTGAWLKERQQTLSYNVNVRVLTPEGQMRDLRIFENDSRGYLVSITQAPRARFEDGAWMLEDAVRSEFSPPSAAQPKVERIKQAKQRWPTEISQEMVAVALLRPDRMSTIALFQYIRHLEANSQTSQRYEIEFWRKVFYPLSCMVMVVLALPFAYLHFRSGGITSYVFGGVLIGISFFMLNNIFNYIGNLQNWQPWLAAGAPGLIYTALSLAAFTFLVLEALVAKAVVLFGHGSRDPLWRLSMENVAARLRTLQPALPVRCAFLELEQPDLGSAAGELVAGGATELTIVPMFLGAGRHALEDLPELVRQMQAARPDVRFVLQKPVGEDDRVLDLIARIALE